MHSLYVSLKLCAAKIGKNSTILNIVLEESEIRIEEMF